MGGGSVCGIKKCIARCEGARAGGKYKVTRVDTPRRLQEKRRDNHGGWGIETRSPYLSFPLLVYREIAPVDFAVAVSGIPETAFGERERERKTPSKSCADRSERFCNLHRDWPRDVERSLLGRRNLIFLLPLDTPIRQRLKIRLKSFGPLRLIIKSQRSHSPRPKFICNVSLSRLTAQAPEFSIDIGYNRNGQNAGETRGRSSSKHRKYCSADITRCSTIIVYPSRFHKLDWHQRAKIQNMCSSAYSPSSLSLSFHLPSSRFQLSRMKYPACQVINIRTQYYSTIFYPNSIYAL